MASNETKTTRKAWRDGSKECKSHIENKRRQQMISQYECNIVPVVDDLPLGCIWLHIAGNGIGPEWLFITMLGDRKVAVPALSGGDYVCRLLGPDPICYGMWLPFSVMEGADTYALEEGDEVGMIQKTALVWRLRCWTPDGCLAWVPLPAYFEDADAEWS